jgi:cellulose 1,4-beta-cellobiosidase
VLFAAPVAPTASAFTAVVSSKTGGAGTRANPYTDSVALSWAPVTGATSYTVQRQRVAGVGPFVAIINATNISTLSVIETGVPMSATPYVYQIRANGLVGNSTWTQRTVVAN